MSLFVRLQQVGITILIATHDQQLIEAVDSRLLVLENGVLIKDTAA